MRRSLLFSTAALVSILGLGCTDGPAPTDPSAPAATEPASLMRAQAPLASSKHRLVTGLEELQGSAVGPDGALYVTAPLAGASGASTRRPARSRPSPAACRPASRAFVFGAGRSTSPSSARPRTRWSPSSARTSAATTSSASTAWTARAVHRHRRHRRVLRGPSAGDRTSSSRPASSTRWSPSAAGSWSPTGTTTACCGSPATARSAS